MRLWGSVKRGADTRVCRLDTRVEASSIVGARAGVSPGSADTSVRATFGPRSGNTYLEAVFFTPILILLLMGMVNLGRLAYTYYTLHKILYDLARSVGTSQGANFCDSTDPTVSAAVTYALTGGSDPGAPPILANLTAEMIQISIERVDPATQTLAACDCSASGCDTSQGGLPPDYIVVSLTDGFPFQFNIPKLTLDPIPLRPVIMLPYGGT